MSLESVLDEERRDVLALLEGPPTGRKAGSISSATGRNISPLTKPQSPVRSMLEIDDDFVAWHGMLNSSNGVATSPRMAPARGLLDTRGISPAASPTFRSKLEVNVTPKSTASSPVENGHRVKATHSVHPRSLSDAATRPAGFGPRASSTGVDIETAYQFTGFLPSNPGGPIIPKRNTQAGKKNSYPNAMAEVVRGGDLSMFGKDRGRKSITGTGISGISSGLNGAKSKSPHNRLGLRSNSPHINHDPSKLFLDNGTEIEMTKAYKKLSDVTLAAVGSLAASGKKGERRRTNSGEVSAAEGSRLRKEYTPEDGEEALDDSSDEDHHSSDEERPRGRKTHIDLKTGMDYDADGNVIKLGRARGARTQMAAAEQERKLHLTTQLTR
jgi:hypothetical protein